MQVIHYYCSRVSHVLTFMREGLLNFQRMHMMHEGVASYVPRPPPCSQCYINACNIENAGVAWGRGYEGVLYLGCLSI
jgi:hypothetical protein